MGEGLWSSGENLGRGAPAWYHNLKAHPDIDVRIGRRIYRAHAEEVGPDRRAELWPAMRKQNPAIDGYAARAGRVLPIMLLRIRPATAAAA